MPEKKLPYHDGSGFRCQRCGRAWMPQGMNPDGTPKEPAHCPSRACGSPYWRTKRMTPKQKSAFLSKAARERAATWRESREDGGEDGERASR